MILYKVLPRGRALGISHWQRALCFWAKSCHLWACARVTPFQVQGRVLVQRANPFSPNNRGLTDCHPTAVICAVIIVAPPRNLPAQRQEMHGSKAIESMDGANKHKTHEVKKPASKASITFIERAATRSRRRRFETTSLLGGASN